MSHPRPPEPNSHAVDGAAVWRWSVRLRQENERRADRADHKCADQPISCGSIRVCVLRSDDTDDQTAGDNAGDPPGVIVALRSAGPSDRGVGPIEIDAEDLHSIEAMADSGGISWRVAEEIAVGHASVEAMHHPVIDGGDDDGLPGSETSKTVPLRIGWHGGRLGQDLRVCGGRHQHEGDECNREPFHNSRC